jgi:hypothetical protein
MSKFKAALIGAGQLGSRHLQGLAKSVNNLDIEVVEPAKDSAAVAKQRYDEVPASGGQKALKFLSSIDELSDNLDVVIVATNSDVRSAVVKSLLSSKKVKYLILEKVLFRTVSEYADTGRLITEKDVTCFVNHTRRLFPVYQSIREELKNASRISFSVQGGGWGLACNGLHFIDIFSYLSGGGAPDISAADLDNRLYETKRKGFVEFNGCLSGKIGIHNFSLSCFEEPAPFSLVISSEVFCAFIDEASGYVRFSKKSDGWKKEISETKLVRFQSELSGDVADSLLNKGTCLLPGFEESASLHIPFIEALMKKMKSIDGAYHQFCPVT